MFVEVETFILNIKPYCLTTLGKRPYSRFMAANILSESFNLETLSLIKEYLLSPNLGAVFLTMPEKKINIESYIQLLTGFSFLFGILWMFCNFFEIGPTIQNKAIYHQLTN